MQDSANSPGAPKSASPVPGAMKLVAFDLETTGLDGATARIIEFCFLELDAELHELSRWTELVDPQVPIPADTVKVHGITDDMVRGHAAFAHFSGRIQALVQDAVLIGHNVKFDLEILSRELGRAGASGLRPNHPCIDTHNLESYLNSHSLGSTYERYYGKTFEGAHRSAADTAASVDVLRAQRKNPKLPKDLEGLQVAAMEKLRNPERAERNWLDHGRKFYADDKGTVFYNFGKYRGQPALATKETKDYLLWMRDKADFPADVKALVVQLLAQAGQAGARPS
jgi:DNA polymerase-3 subunit epsilon